MSSSIKFYKPEPDIIPLNLENYPHLVDSDLFKILRHLPPMTEEGPWVAGGALWRTINKEPLVNCDIDVFFKSKSQFEEMSRKMNSLPYVNNVISENRGKWNTNYQYHVNEGKKFNKTVDIQFVNTNRYSSIIKLLNSFDFTVCQFGWDGKNIYTGPSSIDDLTKKLIVFYSSLPEESLCLLGLRCGWGIR